MPAYFFFSHFIFSVVIFFIAELFVCYTSPSFSPAENPLGYDFKNTCRIKHLLSETNTEKTTNRHLAALKLPPNDCRKKDCE